MGPKVLLSSPWNLKRAGRKGHYLLAFVRLSELRKQHERKKPLVQLVSEGTVSECQFVSILFFERTGGAGAPTEIELIKTGEK
jgi:hypothetical protein